MYDPRELEAFFERHMPSLKSEIERLWPDRASLMELLAEYQNGFADTDFAPLFDDMLYWTKVASHKYTNPWEVL